MIQNIVVAVDGSANANRAVEHAADLAARLGARLTLLHAVRPRTLPPELARFAETEHLAAADDAAVLKTIGGRILQTADDIARGLGASEPEAVMAEGDPATVIVDTARARHADLVVVGCRGLGALGGLLLGSVSHKVTMQAPCSVVVVR